MCGIARFLCTMRVLEFRHHPHPLLTTFCAKFRCGGDLRCRASLWRNSLNHTAYLMRREPKLALRNKTIYNHVVYIYELRPGSGTGPNLTSPETSAGYLYDTDWLVLTVFNGRVVGVVELILNELCRQWSFTYTHTHTHRQTTLDYCNSLTHINKHRPYTRDSACINDLRHLAISHSLHVPRPGQVSTGAQQQ